MEPGAGPNDIIASSKGRRTMSEINPLLMKMTKEYLHIPTLNTRDSDGQGIHELHVSTLHQALEAAYKAGRADAGATATAPGNPRPGEVGSIYVHDADRWVVSFV